MRKMIDPKHNRPWFYDFQGDCKIVSFHLMKHCDLCNDLTEHLEFMHFGEDMQNKIICTEHSFVEKEDTVKWATEETKIFYGCPICRKWIKQDNWKSHGRRCHGIDIHYKTAIMSDLNLQGKSMMYDANGVITNA